MNKEQIKTLYLRAEQYGVAKYGKTPVSIRIEPDGTITLRYDDYCCGGYDYEDYEVHPDSLTEDLDTIAAERKEKEKALQAQRDEENRKAREREEIRRKQERKEQYQKLKKEFEP